MRRPITLAAALLAAGPLLADEPAPPPTVVVPVYTVRHYRACPQKISVLTYGLPPSVKGTRVVPPGEKGKAEPAPDKDVKPDTKAEAAPAAVGTVLHATDWAGGRAFTDGLGRRWQLAYGRPAAAPPARLDGWVVQSVNGRLHFFTGDGALYVHGDRPAAPRQALGRQPLVFGNKIIEALKAAEANVAGQLPGLEQ